MDKAKRSPVVCGGGEQGGELCGMLPVPYPSYGCFRFYRMCFLLSDEVCGVYVWEAGKKEIVLSESLTGTEIK